MAVSESATAEDTAGAGPARPFLDGLERAALRETIRAEIARRRPKPVALQTLELIATAAVEPVEGDPGYRVIDRQGRPRRHPDAGGGAAAGLAGRPLTLAELVDEIVARHPDLFLPAPPEPEPEPNRESTIAQGASEVRAATVRFVEAQSGRARALAERSSEQGRALAQSAAAGFAAFRTRFEAQRAERRAGGGIGSGIGGLRGWRDRGFGDLRQRRWVAGGAGALLATIVAAGVVVGLREGGEAPQRTAEAAKPGDGAATPPPARPAEPPPEAEGAVEAPEQPRAAPNAVTGQAQVIDTATLRLNGKVVHLFGVEWVRGGQADELSRYINNRPVTCQPVPGSENQLCQIEGRDLSEVVLFNGGGRASPEATPELVAAEDHARSERLGVWKR